MWVLPSAPRGLLLPAIFLCGYFKLADTRSTILGGATAMIRPMETIFRTHRPTWDDIIQLLVSLFSTEGRHRILTEARKWFREMAPEGTANPQQWEELAAPMRGPTGTVKQRKGGTNWRYRVTLLQGLKRGARKAMCIAKPSKVIQRETTSPCEFHERL